jgi:hypothetical protein
LDASPKINFQGEFTVSASPKIGKLIKAEAEKLRNQQRSLKVLKKWCKLLIKNLDMRNHIMRIWFSLNVMKKAVRVETTGSS